MVMKKLTLCMIRPNHLESLLKINGLTANATDEAICAVLEGARYTKEESREILNLYRQHITPQETRTDGLHKVFFTDVHLQPHEVSRLLGVEVKVTEERAPRRRSATISPMQFVFIWFISVVVALTGILFYMYINQIGLFHPMIASPW